MALWFVSYATSPITVTIYYVSIVIVYDVTLLLSMTYHFQSRLGKTECTDIWVIKLKNQASPSIGFQVPHWMVYATLRNRMEPDMTDSVIWIGYDFVILTLRDMHYLKKKNPVHLVKQWEQNITWHRMESEQT